MGKIDSVCKTPVKYTIIIEKAPHNYSAYAPDLPGCVAAAYTRDEVVESMREAIEFHLDGLRRDGDPVPPPQTTAVQVEVGPGTVRSSATCATVVSRRVSRVGGDPRRATPRKPRSA